MERISISWLAAEPARVASEKHAMAERAPDMEWREDAEKGFPSGGFEGSAPEWPFDRKRPAGLGKLTGEKKLSVRVEYPQGFPAQPPRLVPLDPSPEVKERMMERVHVNGDGSICLILHPSHWSTADCAADLVEKASGWFIEYLAVEQGLIKEMSTAGMFASEELDEVLEKL